MLKKLIVCDYFLEIACHCLNMNANFGQFKGMCLMHFDKMNGSNSPSFHVTHIGCCKDFVDFQIDLFNKTSFQQRSIDCENTTGRN